MRVDGTQAQEKVRNGTILLDVRTPGEFAAGHLPGARNVPVQTLGSTLGKLKAPDGVVVYCRSGARSAQAARTLSAKGFEVSDLGPMRAWNNEGPGISALTLPLLTSLALGLAPVFPEPHLVGKIRWVMGGAVGMGATDWFDLAMHGAPFVWLAVTAVAVVRGMVAKKPTPASGT